MDGESEQPFIFGSSPPLAFDMFPHLSRDSRRSSEFVLEEYKLVWAHPVVSEGQDELWSGGALGKDRITI